MELICLMADSVDAGVLIAKDWFDKEDYAVLKKLQITDNRLQIADCWIRNEKLSSGCSVKFAKYQVVMAELLDKNICKIDEEGNIYSSKMKREEKLHEKRSKAGKEGAKQKKEEQLPNTKINSHLTTRHIGREEKEMEEKIDFYETKLFKEVCAFWHFNYTGVDSPEEKKFGNKWRFIESQFRQIYFKDKNFAYFQEQTEYYMKTITVKFRMSLETYFNGGWEKENWKKKYEADLKSGDGKEEIKLGDKWKR